MTGARRGLACSRAECCEQRTQRNVTGVWCVAARVWCAACARPWCGGTCSKRTSGRSGSGCACCTASRSQATCSRRSGTAGPDCRRSRRGAATPAPWQRSRLRRQALPDGGELAARAGGQKRPDARACLRRVRRGLARRARAAHGGGRRAGGAAVARHGGAHTQEEARSFIVSSLRRRLGLVICPAASSHATASAGCRTSACRGPSSSGACSRAASSSEDRRRECRSTLALRAVRRLLPVPGRRGTAGRPRV